MNQPSTSSGGQSAQNPVPNTMADNVSDVAGSSSSNTLTTGPVLRTKIVMRAGQPTVVRPELSAFLPHLPGAIDQPVQAASSQQDFSGLRSLIERPPIVGKELAPLTATSLSGFRLSPGGLPDTYKAYCRGITGEEGYGSTSGGARLKPPDTPGTSCPTADGTTGASGGGSSLNLGERSKHQRSLETTEDEVGEIERRSKKQRKEEDRDKRREKKKKKDKKKRSKERSPSRV